MCPPRNHTACPAMGRLPVDALAQERPRLPVLLGGGAWGRLTAYVARRFGPTRGTGLKTVGPKHLTTLSPGHRGARRSRAGPPGRAVVRHRGSAGGDEAGRSQALRHAGGRHGAFCGSGCREAGREAGPAVGGHHTSRPGAADGAAPRGDLTPPASETLHVRPPTNRPEVRPVVRGLSYPSHTKCHALARGQRTHADSRNLSAETCSG